MAGMGSEWKEKQNLRRIGRRVEALYLVLLGVYLFKMSMDTTVFWLDWPWHFQDMLRILMGAAVLLRVSYSEIFRGKEWIFCVVTGVGLGLSFASTGYEFLLETALLIVGAFGIDYKKILQVGLWVEAYVLLTAMLGSVTGVVRDLIYYEDGLAEHSFGIIYPTDFAAHIVFLLLTAWALARPFWRPVLLGLTAAAVVFLVRYNGTRCGIIVLICTAAAMLYSHYLRRLFFRNPGRKWADALRAGAVLICPAVMVSLTSLYDRENALLVEVNSWITNRLSLGRDAMTTYGIKAFGTAFEMEGNGGTLSNYHANYNFVDSSYVLILLRYGWVVLALLCAAGVYIAYRALRAGNRSLYWAVLLVFVHSMIEHHMIEVCYNVFLLLAFARMDPEPAPQPGERRFPVKTAVKAACWGLCAAALLAGGRRIVSYLRTLAYLQGWADQPRLFAAVTALGAGMLLLFVLLVNRLLDALFDRKRLPGFALGMCGALCAVFVLTAVSCEQVLDAGAGVYGDVLEKDRPYLEALSKEGQEAYVGDLTELYCREFDNVRPSVLTGDGLAGGEDVTYFLEDLQEQTVLMEAGFWYGELPGEGAVYTNSQRSKRALESAGVVLDEYYSKQHTADLKQMARKSYLELDARGGVVLSGAGRLGEGPNALVSKGNLQVVYELELQENAYGALTPAVMRVTGNTGRVDLGEYPVDISVFDGTGRGTFTANVNIWAKFEGVSFWMIPASGVTLEVKEIRYGKTQ